MFQKTFDLTCAFMGEIWIDSPEFNVLKDFLHVMDGNNLINKKNLDILLTGRKNVLPIMECVSNLQKSGVQVNEEIFQFVCSLEKRLSFKVFPICLNILTQGAQLNGQNLRILKRVVENSDMDIAAFLVRDMALLAENLVALGKRNLVVHSLLYSYLPTEHFRNR